MDTFLHAGISTTKIELEQDVITDGMKAVQVYGIYPFSFTKALTYFKEQGIKIVYDLDDALGFIDTSNPFYNDVKRDAFSEREILKLADHITVSTPKIKEYIESKTILPINVIPNCYDPKEWNFERKQREGIRIGFAGSATHIVDLIPVLPVIINLQKKHNINFVLMGFAQSDYHTFIRSFSLVCPPQALSQLEEFDRLMAQLRFEWVPYVDFDLYPQVLIQQALDIGLCPLQDTPFNNARSASKAMEYTLSGALALASDTPAYSDPTSIKVTDWEKDIEYYILNKEERLQKHKEHLLWIQENRNMDTQLETLKEVYNVV